MTEVPSGGDHQRKPTRSEVLKSLGRTVARLDANYHGLISEKSYDGFPLDREQSDRDAVRWVEGFLERAIEAGKRYEVDRKPQTIVRAQRKTILREPYTEPRIEFSEVNIYMRASDGDKLFELRIFETVEERESGNAFIFNLGRYETDEECRKAFEKAVQELDQGYRLKLKRFKDSWGFESQWVHVGRHLLRLDELKGDGTAELVPPKEQSAPSS
ncbi:MAG TPA: hypothetical protein VJA47_00185 [archaeon]|nr:hypothetical protein [archaeon]